MKRVERNHSFTARMASRGAVVTLRFDLGKPASRNRAVYSARVRSLPSVQTSMLSDCISAGTGPVLSSFEEFFGDQERAAGGQPLPDLPKQDPHLLL